MLKIGSSDVSKIQVGSDNVSKIVLGTDGQIWPSGSPPLPAGYTDTGLGWAAKTEYLVYSDGTDLGWSGSNHFIKQGDGYAIAVYQNGTPGGWIGPVLVSTVVENLSNGITTGHDAGAIYSYHGLTFYANSRNRVANSMINNTGDLPLLALGSDWPSSFEIILNAAGVIPWPPVTTRWQTDPDQFGFQIGGQIAGTGQLPRVMNVSSWFGGSGATLTAKPVALSRSGHYGFTVVLTVPSEATFPTLTINTGRETGITPDTITASYNEGAVTIEGSFTAAFPVEYVSLIFDVGAYGTGQYILSTFTVTN